MEEKEDKKEEDIVICPSCGAKIAVIHGQKKEDVLIECKMCGEYCCNQCVTYARIKKHNELLDDLKKSFVDQQQPICKSCWEKV